MIDRVDKKELELIAKADPVPKAVNYLMKIGMKMLKEAGRELLDEDIKNVIEPYRSQVVAERAMDDVRGWKALEKFLTALAESQAFDDFMRQEAEDRAEDAELLNAPFEYYGVSKANLIGVN